MRASIQDTLKKLVTTTVEFPIASAWGARRDEYQELGITDAVILHFLSMNEIEPTLMTGLLVEGQIADPLEKAVEVGARQVAVRGDLVTPRLLRDARQGPQWRKREYRLRSLSPLQGRRSLDA